MTDIVERLRDGRTSGAFVVRLDAADEIERLRASIAWTWEVRPGKNSESGGAIVHMTWDQFRTMRALAKDTTP
jgi:hypothetical protein